MDLPQEVLPWRPVGCRHAKEGLGRDAGRDREEEAELARSYALSQALYSEKISTSEGMNTYVKVGRLPGWRRRRRRRRNRKRKRDRENQAAAVTQRSKSWNRRQYDSNTRLSSTECKRGERRCEGAEGGSSSRGAESRTASEEIEEKGGGGGQSSTDGKQ